MPSVVVVQCHCLVQIAVSKNCVRMVVCPPVCVRVEDVDTGKVPKDPNLVGVGVHVDHIGVDVAYRAEEKMMV